MTGLRIKTVLPSLADTQARPRTVTVMFNNDNLHVKDACDLGKRFGSTPSRPTTRRLPDHRPRLSTLDGSGKNGRGAEEVYAVTSRRPAGLRGNAHDYDKSRLNSCSLV